MKKQQELDLGLNLKSLQKELNETSEIKKCDTCKEWLSIDSFAKNAYKPDGLASTCKACNKANYTRKKIHYKALYKLQEGRCAICSCTTEDNRKDFAVDHCHTTGKVRELLCTGCNSGIGSLKDDTELLSKAIDYLEKHNETKQDT
jgi:hypothetical protein